MLEPGTVKAGDELAERYGSYRGPEIVKVARVTPSGQIVLTDGRRFRSNGSEIGDRMVTSSLHILTPELRKEMQQQAHVSFLKNIDWEKIDVKKLEQIVAVLKDSTPQ